MDLDLLLKFQDEVFAECRKVMAERAKDYASPSDALINFKRAASVIDSDAKEVCLTHLASKLARLRSVSDPWDTCLDIINYAIIYLALTGEKEEGGK
jgi:hypothetical protein